MRGLVHPFISHVNRGYPVTPPTHDATAVETAPIGIPPTRSALRIFAATVAVVLCAGSATAQSENPATSPATATPGAPASLADGGEPDEPPVYGLVKPEDGTFLELPPGTTYAEFLE